MRTYIIILSDIKSNDSDSKFSKFVNENKFDFWRYTALNWILLTPDSVSTNDLTIKIRECYGVIFQCVLEININDVGGIFPTSKENIEDAKIPFQWFYKIKEPNFVPRWEKESKTKEKS